MHLQAIRYLQSLYELPESYSVGIVFYVYKEESRKNFTGCFLLQIFSFVRVPMSKTEIVLVKARKLMPIIPPLFSDNHVALLFINKVGGSRCGLSIRLSGIFTYPACFWNQGVWIIEVLL